MEPKKHKRKLNHVVIVTSDAVDAGVKQFRFRPWMVRATVIVLCVIIGILLGYVAFERQIWEGATLRIGEYQEQIKAMNELMAQQEKDATAEKEALEMQVAELTAKLELLSETVNQKVAVEAEMTAKLEALSTPTLLPLSGSASIEEQDGEAPMCVFTASKGALAVATAAGTVFTLVEDGEYGYQLTIDHGNGYQTIYRNKGEALVKVGDSVKQNQTLFIIGEENTTLGYQMIKDGVYIKPTEVMEISG